MRPKVYYDGVLNAQLGWNVNSAQRFKGGGYMVAGVIVYNYDHLVDHSKNTIVSSPSACLDFILKAQMVTSPPSMYITVFFPCCAPIHCGTRQNQLRLCYQIPKLIDTIHSSNITTSILLYEPWW